MKKGLLLILDGYGEAPKNEYNAVTNANTPYLNYLRATYPSSLVYTDGRSVGLPNGAMGGSEVGHTTIGAGRIIKTTTVKIDDEIESGEFFKHKEFVDKFAKLKQQNGALHIGGLFSDKQIHSDLNHAFALMKLAKQYDIDRVFFHAFTDGRDCAQNSSFSYLEKFNQAVAEIDVGEIATIGGRFYAMDREGNLERTNQALNVMQKLDYDYASAYDCLRASHDKGITDEFVVPSRIKTKKEYTFNDNDLFIFYNFRADRMKQPVKVLNDLNIMDIITFCDFAKGDKIANIYNDEGITGTLSEYLSSLSLKQLKISESTKYAHVTYFLNGGREMPFDGEERIHIETEKTTDFALTPKMRAGEIAKSTVQALNTQQYDAIIVNFSNPDMIGHTGNYNATVQALEFLDKCVKDVVETALNNEYFVLLTADHGNAEEMRDSMGNIQTAHSLNPVICLTIDKTEHDMVQYGGLKDIAPTFIYLMGLQPNPKFEGDVLVK
ncbi:MAG: 2,3-bisphosphoglycerate-independent phosphoglycerate mutase [Clostridia bacterium]|nr:2,3-bisphosphoglycerate-independent phosphoglycerate mutase [Clostridia bacterium]